MHRAGERWITLWLCPNLRRETKSVWLAAHTLLVCLESSGRSMVFSCYGSPKPSRQPHRTKLQPCQMVSERTPTAGLFWTEPTEAGGWRFSSRKYEGVSQRPQTSNCPVSVWWSKRVRRHELITITAQNHILRLEALAVSTSIQQLGKRRDS